MKRILLSLAMLTLVAVGVQAQGAGLSQGQAAKQKELMNKVHSNTSMYIQSMLADEKFWEVGDYALFRRLHLGKKIVDVKDKRFLRAQIRLLPPPEGDPSGKPFVFCKYLKKYNPKDSQPWRADVTEWFQITDDETLKPLHGGIWFFVERGGKIGMYELFNDDNYTKVKLTCERR